MDNKGKINRGLILILILIISIFALSAYSDDKKEDPDKGKSIDNTLETKQDCFQCGDGTWVQWQPGKSAQDLCASKGGYTGNSYEKRGGAVCGQQCSNHKSNCRDVGFGICLGPKKIKICSNDPDEIGTNSPFTCKWVKATCKYRCVKTGPKTTDYCGSPLATTPPASPTPSPPTTPGGSGGRGGSSGGLFIVEEPLQ